MKMPRPLVAVFTLLIIATAATALANPQTVNQLHLNYTITSNSTYANFNITCTQQGDSQGNLTLDSNYDGHTGTVHLYIQGVSQEEDGMGRSNRMSGSQIQALQLNLHGENYADNKTRNGTLEFNGVITKDEQDRAIQGTLTHYSTLAENWTKHARLQATIYASSQPSGMHTYVDLNLTYSNRTLDFQFYAVSNNPSDQQTLAQIILFLGMALNATTGTGTNGTYAWYSANGTVNLGNLNMNSTQTPMMPGQGMMPGLGQGLHLGHGIRGAPFHMLNNLFQGSVSSTFNATIVYDGTTYTVQADIEYAGDSISFSTPYGPVVMGPHQIHVESVDGECVANGWFNDTVNPIPSFIAIKEASAKAAEGGSPGDTHVVLSNGGDPEVVFILNNQTLDTVTFTSDNLTLVNELGIEYNGTTVYSVGNMLVYRLTRMSPPIPLLPNQTVQIDAKHASRAAIALPWMGGNQTHVEARILLPHGMVVIMVDKPVPPGLLNISSLDNFPLPPGYTPAGVIVEINTTDKLNTSIVVGLQYNPNVDPNNLVVLHYHNDTWQTLPIQRVDTQNHIVYVRVDQFSVLATAETIPGAAPQTSGQQALAGEGAGNQTGTANETAGSTSGIDPWLITTIIAIIAIIGITAFFLRK